MEFDTSHSDFGQGNKKSNPGKPDELSALMHQVFHDLNRTADESFELTEKGLFHTIMFEFAHDSNN